MVTPQISSDAISDAAGWEGSDRKLLIRPTYHCQLHFPEPGRRLLEVHPTSVRASVLLLDTEEREEGCWLTPDVELGPRYVVSVFTCPQLALLLRPPAPSLVSEVEAVDRFAVAVLVPEDDQDLVPGDAGSDVAGEVGHHPQHGLH